MDLRQLRNLLTVLETGSLRKAAEALHISQPALTKSIRRLEARLNVELFERSMRGMRPTLYAESLRPFAQSVCVDIDRALAQVKALRTGTGGGVSIAAPPLIATALLPEAIRRFKHHRADVSIRIVTTPADLMPYLLSGEYDFIVDIISGEPRTAQVHLKPLMDDWLVVVAAPSHPAARLESVTPSELQPFFWVLPHPDTIHRRRINQVFEAASLPAPNAAIECTTTDLILEIVARGDYLGLVSALAFPGGAHKRNVKILPFNSPLLRRPIGLLWREQHPLSPAAQTLTEIIEAVARKRTMFDAQTTAAAQTPIRQRERGKKTAAKDH
jgi:DNA-binding transcriptional LysR family regulator